MTSAVQHTMTRRLTAWLVALTMILAPVAVGQSWAQDNLAQARQHYSAGKGLFDAGDYRGAIREFESANRLAPSPLLEFNIGLAHERLGAKAEALQHYRAYLQAMPGAANRGTVEAKIQRLEAELGAARTVQESNGGEPAFPADGQAGQAGAQGEGAVDPLAGVRAGNPLGQTTTGSGATGGEAAVHGSVPPPGYPDMTTGAEGAAVPAQPSPQPATGDPMLDRVAAIDVAAIRDQRAHLLTRPEPAAAYAGGGEGTDDKEAKPAYKQVWFWVVVGVSSLILLDMASSD